MPKRKFKRRIYQKNGRIKKFGLHKCKRFFPLLEFAFFSSIICFLIFAILFFHFGKDLPRPEKFTERQMTLPTKIYDRSGEVLLYTIFGEEKRELVSLDQIPDRLEQAIISTEDANFYNHFGIDPKGLARAIWSNIKYRRSIEKAHGASTIPQQLIRSTFLTPEKTIKRKVREWILTLELDRRYQKDQILEWYLNQVPFGSNAYGVEAASQSFFGKNVEEISLAEAAILAGVIRSPGYLSPYGENTDALFQRQNYVLDRMVQEGYITNEEAEEAKSETITFTKVSSSAKAPHFVVWIKQQLIKKYGEQYLSEKGLKVYTTLDIKLQEMAEKAVAKQVEKNKILGAYNAAFVALDPKTGEILALIGSADYFAEPSPENCTPGKDCRLDPEFNVALLGLRQPGSAFKPLVYATAFQKGYDDKYIVVDEETNFGIWGGKPYIPRNYDGLFRGEVTLRQALAQSLNVPSVKVLVNLAGIEDSIKTAQDFGITTLKEPSFYGPSLVLGGGEVKLVEMVSAFGVFSNDGLRNKYISIRKIEDSQGNIIEQNKPNPKRVINSKTANLITDILSDNEARTPMFGANSVLNIKGVSVKTGTTQFFNDAWAIGYNSEIAAGVWVGNNDNTPTYKQPGVMIAAPIWRTFMLEAISNL